MNNPTTDFNFNAAKIERLLLAVFVLMAFSYIVGSSYLGVNGNHTFRQSDVYSSILGFAHLKDLPYFQRFNLVHDPFVYNIPIYEWLIGKTALLTGNDPLVVTRYFNIIFWLLTAYAGYSLCSTFGPARSGIIFVFLLSISPLILHYYSVPLPDSMAISFSLIGILLLRKIGNNWKGLLYAFPFLIVATIIKSPVPFVFIVFYTTYSTVNISFPNGISRDAILKGMPFVALLVMLFLGALFTERLRVMLSTGTQGYDFFAENPGFYFGRWEMRTSLEIWEQMVLRFNRWIPGFLGLYLLTIIAASTLKFERRHLAMTVAAMAAVFLGWFVFPRRHLIHDYYQLGMAIIVFMSFAVSFSHILLWVRDRLPVRVRGRLPVIAAVIAISLSIYLAVWPYKPISVKSRTNIFETVEYALRDESIFLHVNSRRQWYDPRPGGQVSTKFLRIKIEDFEENCETYLNQYTAVFFEGRGQPSECLAGNRQNAVYYIEDDGIIFYMRRRR